MLKRLPVRRRMTMTVPNDGLVYEIEQGWREAEKNKIIDTGIVPFKDGASDFTILFHCVNWVNGSTNWNQNVLTINKLANIRANQTKVRISNDYSSISGTWTSDNGGVAKDTYGGNASVIAIRCDSKNDKLNLSCGIPTGAIQNGSVTISKYVSGNIAISNNYATYGVRVLRIYNRYLSDKEVEEFFTSQIEYL